jgi:hypothetical protein
MLFTSRNAVTRLLSPLLVPPQFLHRFSFSTVMSGFYSLKAAQPGGTIFDFSQLKGKTVLIVNTASAWYVGLRILLLV